MDVKRARRQVESLTLQNEELKKLLNTTQSLTTRLIKIDEKPPSEEDLYNEINSIAEAYEKIRVQNEKLSSTISIRDADLDRYITSKNEVIRENTRVHVFHLTHHPSPTHTHTHPHRTDNNSTK